jgi:hypothetical protein
LLIKAPKNNKTRNLHCSLNIYIAPISNDEKWNPNGLLFFERATQHSWAWLANLNSFSLILALLVVVFLIVEVFYAFCGKKQRRK